MNTLLSTTSLIGQMGYQKPSNNTPHSISHKKVNWFKKHDVRK